MDDNELGLAQADDEYNKQITELRNQLINAITPILRGTDSHLATYSILALGSFLIPHINHDDIYDYKFISHQCGEALRLQMNAQYESLIPEGKCQI